MQYSLFLRVVLRWGKGMCYMRNILMLGCVIYLLTRLKSEEAVMDCLMRVMAILRISTALSLSSSQKNNHSIISH